MQSIFIWGEPDPPVKFEEYLTGVGNYDLKNAKGMETV
jgi:hypothetical protein